MKPIHSFFLIFFFLFHHSALAQESTHDHQELIKGIILTEQKTVEEDIIEAQAYFYINASLDAVWHVLTDYQNLDSFIPFLESSDIIEEHDDEKIVVQIAKTSLLFFTKKTTLKLKVKIFKANLMIQFESMEGDDFLHYDGHWKLQENDHGSGVFLFYFARVKPNFFAPEFVASHIQERDLTISLEAIRTEALKKK